MIQKLDDTYTLSNGVKMPGFGFGTWQSAAGDITVDAVKEAVRVGYRNIDTAAAYHNERSVGEGVRQAMAEYGVKREELFISTKLWNDRRGYDLAMKAFEHSMKELGLEYLDLYMIHWPAVEKWHDDWRQINRSTWKAFEELYHDGRIKAIGVSNFLAHHVKALMEDGDIAPMVNQIEYHPGFGQVESADFCRKNGIVVQAWSPFGTGDVLKNATLTRIAAAHNKTTAQICLRWLIQKDIVPLPKSVHEERIAANAKVFDFVLTSDEMDTINTMPYCGGMRFDPDEAKS
ncbi:MAG: aldo/keto reductase [Clostridium sp.]|nr:aldo/keto reductase [Clostridium sp.]